MKRIWITLGDPAGIGPEVVEKALETVDWPSDCIFTVLGNAADGQPGRPNERSARSAYSALCDAADALVAGQADAVVTGPVSKERLQAVGFAHPGQTEFFADAFGVKDFGMLLTGPRLTVGLATIHIGLAQVPRQLASAGIVTQGRLVAEFLRRRGVVAPRIAVAGLNPHAGENGVFGDEEARIIMPAVRELESLGVAEFTGPEVPDAVFRDAAQGRYHAVLAMYHDQGLIPLKLLDFDEAVNVTLGLPRPRVSPDHGTAFGIAGKGVAKADSMIAAIGLACELAGGSAAEGEGGV